MVNIRKAQSMVEIVMLGAAVVAALLFFRAYLNRAYQGRIKSMADSALGQGFDPYDGSFEKSSFQEGQVDYEVSFKYGSDVGVSGEAGTRLYPASNQTIGHGPGAKPMVSGTYTKSEVSFD